MIRYDLKKCFLLAGAIFAAAAIRAQVIPIETAHTGLYLTVGNDSTLYVNYLGERLESPQEILRDYDNRTPNVRETETEAYPAFGNGNAGETALQATHFDGNRTTVLRYTGHKTIPDGEVIRTVVTLRDAHYPLTVCLTYQAYRTSDVITARATIHNEEPGDVLLENFASATLGFPAANYYLSHFYGAWAMEQQMLTEALTSGVKVIDSKKGVRTCQSESPSFILSKGGGPDERRGEVVLGALAWSGNYKLSFQVDNLGRLTLVAGMNNYESAYRLQTDESLETPELIFSYSASGVGQASRNFHAWARNGGIRGGDVVRPVVLNSWEGAYFKFDEKVIRSMMDDAVSMGVEMFVLDDGWFGNKYPRDNDGQGLGDWQVNRRKLPGGLDALIGYAHKKGLRFGLWVEPEMVNPKSELAQKHPEWIVMSPNREPLLWRNQLILDLSNPDVQEFVYQVVADLLRRHPGIEYIKWDANRHVENFGSSYLNAGDQSRLWIDYVHGLYNVYGRLAADFPEVLMNACSSGGGRSDLGAMHFHHEFWPSDNTDALSRVKINWGYSYFFPAQSIASHVSQSPNHQTHHITPIKFRFDVSMAQRLGLELQPALLTAEELEWTRRGVKTYKRIRDLVQFGDLYRLVSPYDEDRSALMYVDAAKIRAVMFAYVTAFHNRENFPMIRLDGLDPAKKYRVSELMPAETPGKQNGKPIVRQRKAFAADGEVFSGDFLMKYGMRVKIRFTYDSAVFLVEEVKE